MGGEGQLAGRWKGRVEVEMVGGQVGKESVLCWYGELVKRSGITFASGGTFGEKWALPDHQGQPGECVCVCVCKVLSKCIMIWLWSEPCREVHSEPSMCGGSTL